MSSRCPRIAVGRTFERLFHLALGVALGSVVVACAPDSVRSVQATGFNAYFKQLASACKPLLIGSADVGQWIQFNDMGTRCHLQALLQPSLASGLQTGS